MPARKTPPRTGLTRKPRAPSAARAEAPPIKLNAAQRAVLGEALRLGTDLADEMRSKVSAYGRWLLEEVFDYDSAAALDEKTENPVWLELARRAGGPTLQLSRRMLYVAVHVAAYDRRIADQSWRALDAGRKEILLPLRDEDRLREAARQVSKFNLSQSRTRAFVTQLLTEKGRARQSRWTAAQLGGRMKKLRDQLAGAAALKRARELRARLDDSSRDAVLAEIDELREALAALRKVVATK